MTPAQFLRPGVGGKPLRNGRVEPDYLRSRLNRYCGYRSPLGTLSNSHRALHNAKCLCRDRVVDEASSFSIEPARKEHPYGYAAVR